jgi:hypothetical protein
MKGFRSALDLPTIPGNGKLGQYHEDGRSLFAFVFFWFMNGAVSVSD